MKKQTHYTVGELAGRMECTVRTLQYYDRLGLLKPSARSEGGRRLYTDKDMVRLHQILSLKYLGFSLDEIRQNLVSLDTPQEVAAVLEKQKSTIRQQIFRLNDTLAAIETLHEEVSQMQEVDFNKYANIVSQLRLKNEGYWIVKHFDNKLMEHIKNRFGDDPDTGFRLFKTWQDYCEEITVLHTRGEDPGGERGQQIAKVWWEMVMEFTGGDMSLLAELEKFNESKTEWNERMRKRQEIADEFLSQALAVYFENQGIRYPEPEGKQ